MLLVARAVDPGVLPAMVAPLVILLPGGLLTIGVIELATGQIMSGAARAAARGDASAPAGDRHRRGIRARRHSRARSRGANPLGLVAPVDRGGVFGIGITVYQCARPESIGWILVVLYVAYGAQVLGDVLFDGVLSALVGAAVMTPVAVVIARQRTGPPALVSFLPAFWLLVPGALGLIGVASVLYGDLGGASTIITTVATMIAIALGVLLGLAMTGSLRGFAEGESLTNQASSTNPTRESRRHRATLRSPQQVPDGCCAVAGPLQGAVFLPTGRPDCQQPLSVLYGRAAVFNVTNRPQYSAGGSELVSRSAASCLRAVRGRGR